MRVVRFVARIILMRTVPEIPSRLTMWEMFQETIHFPKHITRDGETIQTFHGRTTMGNNPLGEALDRTDLRIPRDLTRMDIPHSTSIRLDKVVTITTVASLHSHKFLNNKCQ